jgi:thymidine phosphorylase
VAAVGAEVGPGSADRPLAIVHAADEGAADIAAARLRELIAVGPEAVPRREVVTERVE